MEAHNPLLKTTARLVRDIVVRPWIMGGRLEINAFAVFVVIIIGGLIRGVSAMFLFILTVGFISIIPGRNRESGVYAIFFPGFPRKRIKPVVVKDHSLVQHEKGLP